MLNQSASTHFHIDSITPVSGAILSVKCLSMLGFTPSLVSEPDPGSETSLRISLCTDFLMRKNYGFTPNLDFNPLPMRFNFTEFLPPSGVCSNQGRREQVSMVSV